MSAALPAGAGEEGVSFGDGVDRAVALLLTALDLVDSIKAPPEIGARIQEVIDTLEEIRRRSATEQR
jgi:hypothetical protein